MARKSTGKRLRFEVFHRDHFTCQYCGVQPPDVVLVVDHITPVAQGGTTTLDNLITACEPCNQGKADRGLGHVAPRPDADLLYLATQQETAELRRYQAAVREKEAALAEITQTFQDQWSEYSGEDWCPADQVVRGLLDRYGPDIAGRAMVITASAIGSGRLRIYDRAGTKWLKYLYGVARNIADDETQEEDEG
jgi:HNH endonuclease